MIAFDLFGPGFATLYAFLVLAATMVGLALRMGLERADDDESDTFAPALHPMEVAYLAGGVTAAMEAAVASVRRRALSSRDTPVDRLEALHGVLVHDVLPAERAAYTLMAKHGGAVERARREADSILAPVRVRLAWLKLVAPATSVRRVQRLQLLLFGVLLALGGAQIIATRMSVAPGAHPDYVVLTLCGAAALVLAYVRPTPPYRSRRGQRLLDDLRARHIGLLWRLRHESQRLPTSDYVLAVALFGERERAEGDAYAVITRLATPRSRSGVGMDGDAVLE